MKQKKHQFHCSKCDAACEIYKKGKSHRILVCPNCGILATNPLPLLAAGGMALARSGILKKGIKSASSLIGLGGGKDEKITPPSRQTIITDSKDKANIGERYVKMALGG